jgi:hypothetical protein
MAINPAKPPKVGREEDQQKSMSKRKEEGMVGIAHWRLFLGHQTNTHSTLWEEKAHG